MMQQEYVVWNPANVKAFGGKPKTALLKPRREPVGDVLVGKPRVYVNYTFSTER